jgi:Tetratricopeptide repeat
MSSARAASLSSSDSLGGDAGNTARALAEARRLAAAGDDAAARQAYVALLQRDPTQRDALVELGALADACGYRAAARTAFRQAVHCHPRHPTARVALGNCLLEDGDPTAAREQYRAALAADPACRAAHQGLARALVELGEAAAAEPHWRAGFAGGALVARRCRGAAPGVKLLLLVSARGGNIPTRHWIDERRFAVTALYAEFHDPARPLPRAQAAAADLDFPLLLRSPGFHTGRHFRRVAERAALAGALAALPGETLLAIQYLDARGPDGLARKYRVMFIDGVAWPVHLAIAADWKVHYFTADMAADAAYRAEEARFLADMPGVLGPRAIVALDAVAAALGLDYAGVDFARAADGTLLLFEANAAMVLNPPDPAPIWDYRRASLARALAAAQRLLAERAGCAGPAAT